MKPLRPVRIVIFAKAPQPGLAKTRLIPVLGIQGAADLARRMLAQTVRKALAAALGPVELCVTPSAADPVWQTLAVSDAVPDVMQEAVQWSDQGGGDLGQRMARVTQRVIDGGESVLLIGTDCPQLGAAHLQRAGRALQRSDAALLPTFDGGYALLGLNRFHPSLFEDIVWSSAAVAAETLDRFGQLGWTVHSQPMLHDIDEPADLQWLPGTWRRD